MIINDLTLIKVKNKKGTRDDNPPKGYSTWREYWEYSKKRKFGKCSNIICQNNAEDGAHVVTSIPGHDIFIVPFCSACNHHNNEDYMLVLKDDLLKI